MEPGCKQACNDMHDDAFMEALCASVRAPDHQSPPGVCFLCGTELEAAFCGSKGGAWHNIPRNHKWFPKLAEWNKEHPGENPPGWEFLSAVHCCSRVMHNITRAHKLNTQRIQEQAAALAKTRAEIQNCTQNLDAIAKAWK